MSYHLAIDIGASSGRHLLFHVEDGRLVQEEVYRFPNDLIEVDGQLCWDFDLLFDHIIEGMRVCDQPFDSVSLDTWGVDYVFLDENDEPIRPFVSYRDHRTQGMDKYVHAIVSEEELYVRCGIQKISLNSIYQLMAVKLQTPEVLQKAKTFFMVPDYFNFLLTGIKTTDYTNASTTALLEAESAQWAFDLIERLGYPTDMFLPVQMPGTAIGPVKPEIAEKIGACPTVILGPSHDTASAVLAVPAPDHRPLYISSGTWSLMGTERMNPDTSERSRRHNFTNEGGYEKRFRYLKNIMGLWMIQSVKKELAAKGENYSYAQLCDMAEQESISSIVNCDDDRFLAPKSMIEQVIGACGESGQQVPESAGQLARVIYRSLAQCYAQCKREVEDVTGHKFSAIHIVGGGSQADYLNRLTVEACRCDVFAGPSEATAIGNAVCQMIAAGVFENATEARRCIYESFGCKHYQFKGENA